MNKQHLIDFKALQDGHFQLSSGLHSSSYVQCERLNESYFARYQVKESVKNRLYDFGYLNIEPVVIIGGAYGAIKFADRVSDAYCRCVPSPSQ